MKLLLLAFCCISTTLFAGINPIRINEVMSSNGGIFTDQSGDAPDWIELYNSGKNVMNLGGYGLTDRIDEPFKWVFPDRALSPGKYLIVFASGKNLLGGELHTNFKISSDGESVYLFNPGASIVDSVKVIALKLNTSYGRTRKDPKDWAIFTTPTPGAENSEESFADVNVGVPEFSIPGGVFSSPFKVKLTAPNATDTIYYTTNNSIPTRSSKRYSGEFSISKTNVIKARILKSGMLPGETVTNSYVIYRTKLPVVSVSLDSLDLWDWNTGIYVDGPNFDEPMPHLAANYWQDWEKACHFEMMETSGKRVIDLDAGIKIFGNWSRVNAQKSMAVHCRKKYGQEYMKYKIFNDRPFDQFYSLVTRNSGNDWNNTMFRDGLMASLTIGLHFDQMAYRPAAIFLNGEYWGLLNLREKIDENFIALNNNVKPADVIMLENNGDPLIGVADDWWNMYNFLEKNTMTVQANYDRIATKIDIESFTDYYASQIFYANGDWPGNNTRYWKTTDPSSKWRWIMYDTDFGMGLSSSASYNTLADATTPNGTQWYDPPWSTLIIRKLLENPGFRNQFVNRFADLMNSTFLPTRINKVVDEDRDRISDEITRHLAKWKAGTQAAWLTRVQQIKTFVTARPGYVFGHISSDFGFQLAQIVTVNADSVAGSIQLNTLNLKKFPWKGKYFPNVPVTLTALPNAGYRFLRWEGITSNSTMQTITVSPKANLALTAIFESDGSHYENLVINEISFNNAASPDPGDWIEIYNKGKEDTNVSGWKLTDSDANHQFIFESNTWIKANEYLVVSNDLDKMNAVFGPVKNLIGTFQFGLGSETDAVRLFSQNDQLIDEVSYSNVLPWKTFDLTKCWSLELTNPAKDNNSGLNWVFSVGFGTPGMHNTPFTPDAINDFALASNTTESLQNYPNPFKEGTFIEFTLPQSGNGRISIFDMNGRIIRTLMDDNQISTVHTLYWDGKDNSGKEVAKGIYLYRFECGGYSQMNRMVKM